MRLPGVARARCQDAKESSTARMGRVTDAASYTSSGPSRERTWAAGGHDDEARGPIASRVTTDHRLIGSGSKLARFLHSSPSRASPDRGLATPLNLRDDDSARELDSRVLTATLLVLPLARRWRRRPRRRTPPRRTRPCSRRGTPGSPPGSRGSPSRCSRSTSTSRRTCATSHAGEPVSRPVGDGGRVRHHARLVHHRRGALRGRTSSGQTGARDLGWHGTEAVLLGSGITGLLKGVLGRARPDMFPDTRPSDFSSTNGFIGGESAVRSLRAHHDGVRRRSGGDERGESDVAEATPGTSGR